MIPDYNAPVTQEEAALIQSTARVFDPTSWGCELEGY